MAKVVKIANPVYDTYFKLLMQDLRIAKFLIGTIIGEEIVEVHPYPNERVKIKVNEKVPRLMRFDYSAKVKRKRANSNLLLSKCKKPTTFAMSCVFVAIYRKCWKKKKS